MRRILKAFGLIVVGGGLMWGWHWIQEYIDPEVIAPSEVHVAWLLGVFADSVLSDIGEKQGSQGAAQPGLPPLVICVDRKWGGRRPTMEFLRNISYFRALAKPWDPRGPLLDWRWARAAVRRYANDVLFDVELLKASLSYWTFLSCGGERLTFMEDCRTLADTGSSVVIKLVAVSPAIKNPYCIHREVDTCFGFFAAMEGSYTGGQTRREVWYFARLVVSQSPWFRFDGIAPPTKRIPEGFWRDEFGGWKSMVDVARDIHAAGWTIWSHSLSPSVLEW